MSVFKKIKDAVEGVKETVRALDETMPPLPKEQPKPTPKKPRAAKLVRGLGERIGFAGIVAFTAGAALLGAAGCRLGDPTPSGRPTCDEPASWCAASAVQR